jgi:hypothetical protein
LLTSRPQHSSHISYQHSTSIMPSVLPTTENSKLLGGNASPGVTVTHTFSIEIFRVVAFVSILSLFIVGGIISSLYVFAPEVPGTTILGMTPTGTRDVTDTAIYKIFGFNHTCNVVDFNPSKEFAAIAVCFFVFPFQMFLVLSHMRANLAHKNNEIPAWQVTYSTITTPFNLLTTGIIHLWFVNSPQMAYPDGYGFIGHYIPYFLFQITMSLVAIGQLHYVIAVDKIPWNISAAIATFYVRFVIFITIFCQACVFAILAGHPILDSAAGGVEGTWERTLFVFVGNVYALTALVAPLIFSFTEMRNGDTNTITFAHQ